MNEIDPKKVNLFEKDIEDWLFDNPDTLGVHKWLGRQYQVPSGIIDLWGISIGGAAIVVEIKNVEIDEAAVLQVCRYAADIEAVIYKRSGCKFQPYVNKYVIGKGSVSNSVQYGADAVGVRLFNFEVHLSLVVKGPWSWTREKRNTDNSLRETISLSDDFEWIDQIKTPEEEEDDEPETYAEDNDNQDDLPKVFRDFIDKNVDGEDTPSED